MTQGDLEKELGKSKNSISSWERGASAPTVENLRAICIALRVEPAFLMGMSSGRRRGIARGPVEAMSARIEKLREDAGSLPGLIDGLGKLEAEAKRLRESI